MEPNAEILGRIGHAAMSALKTTVLRKDRLDDAAVDRRLAVCRECPGGHVRFKREGRLLTCGQFLEKPDPNNGKKPCGCILQQKARDAKEDCPFGYWPTNNPLVSQSNLATGGPDENTPNEDAIPSSHPAEKQLIETLDHAKPEVVLEKSSTGRTRRKLNVDERRTRLEASHLTKVPNATKPIGNSPLSKPQKPSHEDTFSMIKEAPLSNDEAATSPTQELSLYDLFDRVVVVNLDRRTDRMENFKRQLAEIDWPFRQPERFRAVDGRALKTPAWWRVGGGAWGCHQSHVRIIEQALMDNLESILILEDDALFDAQVREKSQQFFSALPDDWQQAYLGGQHLFQRRQAPIQINNHVVKPFNVNRTHAYALHRRGMKLVYSWLNDYVSHGEHPRHHVDHRLGALHGSGKIKVYAPTKWIAGQGESHSNIKGKHMPSRFWNGHRIEKPNAPFVAVVGLHRSGSSCLAGVLHKLGVHMGDKLGGYESTGGFEAVGLFRLCEKAFPFPATEPKIEQAAMRDRLSKHIKHVQQAADKKGTIAGGKYPQLCAMGDELKSICGKGLRVIHINRPLEESIASLITRSRKSKNWLGVPDNEAEQVQRWLWDRKERFLSEVEHFTLEYWDLLDNPEKEIDRIIDYLKIKPSAQQREDAIKHVKPSQRKHFVDQQEQVR